MNVMSGMMTVTKMPLVQILKEATSVHATKHLREMVSTAYVSDAVSCIIKIILYASVPSMTASSKSTFTDDQ